MKQWLRDALAEGGARLRAAGIESARLDARVLLADSLGVAPDLILLRDQAGPEQLQRFERLVLRRARREPLAYIIGRKEFWSLDFAVGPGVLVPRSESETLVEESLREFPDAVAPLRVLDIGTGSGCLLIAFLGERPNARGVGIDSSDAALAWARGNAIRHGLAERCYFARGDWQPPDEEVFDLIFANPPYLSDPEYECSEPELTEHEPRQALAAGPDGLEAMRALAPVLARRLDPSGRAFLEIGAGQGPPVQQILAANGLEVRRTIPDLSGIPRCLAIGRAEAGSRWAPKNSVGKELATG